MHPAVVALPLEDKGFVLATMLAHGSADEATSRLGGERGVRCAAAITALAAAPKPERASALAALIALARAPVPAGIERVHPGWLRERFEPETTAVIRAAIAGLPPEVVGVAEDVLAARQDDSQEDSRQPPLADAVTTRAELQRVLFAGLVPTEGPGAPVGARVRELLALAPTALVGAIERAGAETLGTSLRAATADIVARAAAGIGDPWADAIVEAAARDGSARARDNARALVAAAGKPAAGDVAWELGVRTIADELGDDTSAIEALAQRLPPARGRRLLDVAAR